MLVVPGSLSLALPSRCTYLRRRPVAKKRVLGWRCEDAGWLQHRHVATLSQAGSAVRLIVASDMATPCHLDDSKYGSNIRFSALMASGAER